MSYADGEAKLLTVVSSTFGFSAQTVSRGDWKLLNKGRAARYAIIKPGDCTREWISFSAYRATNRAIIQVWERYKDDGTSLTTLEGFTDLFEQNIMASRRLGDTTKQTVLDANIVEVREVQEMWTKGGGPQWLRQDVVVEWIEIEQITFSDS